ncbi:MAG: 23S rRNA (uracil(1939)-C(5))-methyltransferase RlmD [Lachnospiraceae bacterium]|nr:23S rRNA (uracil(1939)-C(5))-methyltransferase RlmD [Lachnospiraceae bacterium]
MKKGEIHQGTVERVDFPNKGVLHVDGRTCIVKNTLPGQTISFRVTRLRNGRAEGTLQEVIAPAPEQLPAPCPHFGLCGGCTYLNLPYAEQLKIKEEQVKRLLAEPLKAQEREMSWEGIFHADHPYEYRNKMEFTFGDEYKDGPLSLGMHKRGSFYDVVTVSDCRIVDQDYRDILTATLSFFQERRVSYYHRLRHTGALRHLLVRKAHATGEILAALVTSGELRADSQLVADYRDMLLSLPLSGSIQGILHIRNDSVADTVQSDETTVLFGRDFIYEKLLGLTFKISTFSFFQTNSPGAEVLYSTARRYIQESGGGTGTVFDLYSGTGTIAQLMAPAARQVIGVEIVEEAVEAARENAALNGLTNCTFLAGDVLKVLDTIPEKPDLIILDPPRDGVHPKALQKILAYGVKNMIYISCKPTSLARDMEAFLAAGYEAERGCCADQFPWTGNVETCVLLVKASEAQLELRDTVCKAGMRSLSESVATTQSSTSLL